MRIVRSRLFGLVILGISLLVIFTLPRSIYSLWKKRDIVREREIVLENTKAQNEKLKKELNQAQTPQFVEKVARNNLGMIKEGEKIVLMAGTQSAVASESANLGENQATWRQWWILFF